jgi:4-carboxymuconolactone decarboxylase
MSKTPTPNVRDNIRATAPKLDNGVTHDEIIETITHLAFYSGWPTAMTAAAIAKDVFADRED